MNKSDLLLTDIEVAKFPLPDHRHTLRDMKHNVADYASLKTAKAIRDEVNNAWLSDDPLAMANLSRDLDSIIEEIEKGT